MAFYDSDGEDDARSYFPCPFCCVEIEVPVLCSHLQEEHCFDLKNAVRGLFSLVYIFNLDLSLQRVFCSVLNATFINLNRSYLCGF